MRKFACGNCESILLTQSKNLKDIEGKTILTYSLKQICPVCNQRMSLVDRMCDSKCYELANYKQE